ncbi:MAG: DUF6778 family protein [Halocynthiibacter sp.]
MNALNKLTCAALVAMAAGCMSSSGTTSGTSGAASQAAAVEGTFISANVRSVKIIVPETLTVSEENSYKPKSDIVWREDPYGNRLPQVEAIMKTAVNRGAATARGKRSVNLDVQVLRFHALTEKTRYSVGGTHDIRFLMTLKDPSSGTILAGPHYVHAEFRAYGGSQALEAERRGETQKKRIIDHVSNVIATKLRGPLSANSGDANKKGFFSLF